LALEVRSVRLIGVVPVVSQPPCGLSKVRAGRGGTGAGPRGREACRARPVGAIERARADEDRLRALNGAAVVRKRDESGGRSQME
jgi:hypothetical protein